MRERDIFIEALQKSQLHERAAYLQEECAGDDALRQRVLQLLAEHEKQESFLLDAPPPFVGDVRTIDQPATETPGTMIGPYKLLQQIGEGGMGTVYMAEQTEPIQRKVALKIIKAGMDSRQVIARFEAERQALAMMDHVNIARVFDGGTIPLQISDCRLQIGKADGEERSSNLKSEIENLQSPGRPYFVMELVHGVPITKYCDDNHLTPRERLELFVPVCQAIQHAHQKGIIHRDIKPSNVMVTLYDGKPVPKVIDFGVAKATEQKLTERTLFTQYGTMVGTLEYMSPEQAEMSALGVDTRSDIYSLGVLLYELLTGSTPLTHKRMKEAAYAEILRMIKEEEPPKPSTRLSDSGEALASISANRQTEPAKLTKLVKGELDWIVMKTLDKDRNRRYETANGFAADVQRYLADEPVQACPPSAMYRFRKFARRNKVALVTSGLVAAALLIGTAVSVWQAIEATNARRLADERLENENEARVNEEQQRMKADERRRQAEATADLLESVFKNLDPHAERKGGLDLKDQLIAKLDEAAAQLERGTADPLTHARLQKALGIAFEGLGEANKAIIHLERSLETRQAMLLPDHPDTLTSMAGLAGAYHAAGKLDLALPLHAQTLEKRQAIIGPDHPDTLVSMSDLAFAYHSAGKLDLAVPLYVETLEKMKAKLGPDHDDTHTCMNNLATAYEDADKLDLALSLHAQTLDKMKVKLGPDHARTLVSMNNLGSTYQKAGRLDLALPLLEQTLEKMKAKLGPDHPYTLNNMNNLAGAYRAAGKLDLAVPLYLETLEKMKAKLGFDHFNTLRCTHNLGGAYLDGSKLDLALPLFRQALEKQTAKLGPDHNDTLASINSLAHAYLKAGKLDLALPLLKQALEMRKAKLGPDHRDTLSTMNNLAAAYRNAGKLDLALPLMEQALAKQKAKFGPDHRDTLHSMNNLACAYEDAAKYDLAVPLFEQTLEIRKAKLGPDHADTLATMANLAGGYRDARKLDLALPLFLQTVDRMKDKLGPDHPDTLNTMNGLALAYKLAGKFDLAVPLFAQALEKRRAKLGADHPDTLITMNNLASAYTEQKQFGKAEPLLREVLAAQKKVQGAKHPATVAALAQLCMNLVQQRKFVEAEPLLRDCLKSREQLQPDAWSTFNSKSMLGGSLLSQKKYAEAEPLLLEGYEGMKVREKTIPSIGRPRLTEAVEHLVELYDALGNKEQVAAWRQRLAEVSKSNAVEKKK